MALGIRSNYVMFDPRSGGSTSENNPNFINGQFDPWSVARNKVIAEEQARANAASVNSANNSLLDLADPFRTERAGYQTQLRDLMTNPAAALTNNPFLKASSEQGMEAANRKLAQMGMDSSGNAALELQKASQANLSGDYFKLADLLGGFSGASASPSAAAQTQLGAMQLGENQRQFDVKNQALLPATTKLNKLSSYWGG